MVIVTVSSKFQIVIPPSIRESLGIKPGEKIHLLPYQNRIEFIPQREMKKMRGFLKGIDTRLEREKDRA